MEKVFGFRVYLLVNNPISFYISKRVFMIVDFPLIDFPIIILPWRVFFV